MLILYLSVCKEEIAPVGQTLYLTDTNCDWKKRKISIASNTAENRYNLVQLHSSPQNGGKFQICDLKTPQAKPRKPKEPCELNLKSDNIHSPLPAEIAKLQNPFVLEGQLMSDCSVKCIDTLNPQ